MKIYENLGIDSLVCPEDIAAQEIINLLHQTARLLKNILIWISGQLPYIVNLQQ
jgi:hypothetical protein